MISCFAVGGIGEVTAGQDLAAVLAAAVELRDGDVLVVMNASPAPLECTVPGRAGAVYEVALDTGRSDGAGDPAPLRSGDVVTVGGRTLWCAIAPLPS